MRAPASYERARCGVAGALGLPQRNTQRLLSSSISSAVQATRAAAIQASLAPAMVVPRDPEVQYAILHQSLEALSSQAVKSSSGAVRSVAMCHDVCT